MKIDVLIEYNERLSEVSYSSEATRFAHTRPAIIELSCPNSEKYRSEIVEFVGENQQRVKNISDEFKKDRTRKDWTLRIINPFETATFEPVPLFRVIDFLSIVILARFYPETWGWRRIIPLLNRYELTLRIPGYNLFNPKKKLEFEKLLHTKYKRVSFAA